MVALKIVVIHRENWQCLICGVKVMVAHVRKSPIGSSEARPCAQSHRIAIFASFPHKLCRFFVSTLKVDRLLGFDVLSIFHHKLCRKVGKSEAHHFIRVYCASQYTTQTHHLCRFTAQAVGISRAHGQGR